MLCDGVGVACLLNATLVFPKFEVAAYWNESSAFGDVFDVDFFIQQMSSFIKVIKELPAEIASKEPFHVDCSKRKGLYDYVESVLPSLLEHRYISFMPAMSQRRDRYPLYAKAAFCQVCYNALRLTSTLEKKASELLEAIPKPFLSLHLRFEPDMVAYSQCEYSIIFILLLCKPQMQHETRKPGLENRLVYGETRVSVPSHQMKPLSSFKLFLSEQSKYIFGSQGWPDGTRRVNFSLHKRFYQVNRS